MKPRVSLIVAMAKNRVIGANNALPWHLPADLKRFKALTMGHHIVMGRKTYESIGKPLPGRTAVIVTRNQGYSVSGAIVASSLEAAFSACGNDEEVFVIGGEQLFRQALPIADRLYLTTVEADVAGDAFMPEIDFPAWREISSEFAPANEKNAYDLTFSVIERSK